MKLRWYFSTLIIALTLIGAICEQQISVPNQEIVLQFTDIEVTIEDAQQTLSIVKNQLQDLGVENIQVSQTEKGKLKITYYSDADVAIIKNILSKEKTLELDYRSFNQDGEDTGIPSDEPPIAYNLDIHEIQKSNDTDWDFEGNYVLEPNPKSNRFFNPNVYMSIENIDVRNKDNTVKLAYRLHKNIAIAIDNSSHNIPEVRAGPIC